MKPEYPVFKPLGQEDQSLLAEHLALSPRTTCDLALANLYLWRGCEVPSITFINGNLCVLIESHFEPRYFLEPLGVNSLLDTVEICLRHTGRISRASELLASQLPPQRFDATPLRDHFDYIYEVQSLAQLKGKKYDGKRNQIRKFSRLYPGYEFAPLAGTDQTQALDLFNRWSRERQHGSRAESAAVRDCQRQALQHAFAGFNQLKLMGGAIFLAGRMEGFIIASADGSGTATAHLQYANSKLSGIYQVLLWETCRNIFSSYTYLNLEEDLGIPGLRKTKLSYQPLRLEKKFLITPR